MGLETLTSSSASAMNRLQSNVVKAFTGYYRLKDFIHALRACKTQAAERALVAKESFAIRTSFKEDITQDHRYHSVSKLLYIHLLGYPSHFGQVECLKLAASPRLTDKRLGYFGVVLLLDEEQQILTLVTNSLKSDLNSASPAVVGLALSTLASIGSIEIAYELADEVEKLLTSSNPYIRKKAGFCACRLIEKVPDLAEQFEGRVTNLVSDSRNHAVVLSGVSLAFELIKQNPTVCLPMFRRSLLNSLVRLLQGLIGNSFSVDYDVSGINDPFLQVQILKLLRVLGRGDVEASDGMSDVLTQLAASIDGNRNSGQAVLYEALLTILSIKADNSLRSMAVTMLARLMSTSNDNNLRYVSLELLSRVLQDAGGGEIVQKHREIVLECLEDPDESIRRRAIDVSLALVNRVTIKTIVAHLQATVFNFASFKCDSDLKSQLITKVAVLAAQHAPNGKWYVDTVIFLLGLAGPDSAITAREELASTFVRIINNTTDVQLYATQALWEHCQDVESKEKTCAEPIIQVTCWCLGEYGGLLAEATMVTAEQILSKLKEWTQKGQTTLSAQTLSYIITALGKLSLRFEPKLDLIQACLQKLAKSASSEVAQKAHETLMMVGNVALRSLVFAPVPADKKFALGAAIPNIPPSMSNIFTASSSPLLDRGESPAPVGDVFAELALLSLDGLGTPSGASSASSKPSSMPFSSLASPLGGQVTADKSVYKANGLVLQVKLVKPSTPADHQTVHITARNTGFRPAIENFQLLCAVPKSLRVVLEPATGTSIPTAQSISQNLKIYDATGGVSAPETSKIKLRLKFSFTAGHSVTETIEVSSLE